MASVKNINTDYTLNVGTPAGDGIFTVNAETLFTGNVTYTVPSITTSSFLTVAANNTGAITDMGLLAQTNANLFAGLRFDVANSAWQTSNSVNSNGSPITAYANINNPPGGPNTAIQFNVNGSFGGNANLTFNSSTRLLALGGNLSVSGNVYGKNFTTTGSSGNITGANIIASTAFTTNGNVYGGNIISNNINSNNIFATTKISAAGNIITNQAFVGNALTGNALIVTSTYSGLRFSVTGNINAGNTWITNVPDPVNPTDVANKEYVDGLVNGLQVKASSNVATTGNILTTTGQAYTYNNGASGVGATITFNSVGNVTIDTVLLTTGMRVLIKNEPLNVPTDGTTPSAAYNGIYNVTT
ncbi:MAG: hypothetical protein WCP55_11370, partial [Lentisphaerota bacterium]